jgi:hypothetical protein
MKWKPICAKEDYRGRQPYLRNFNAARRILFHRYDLPHGAFFETINLEFRRIHMQTTSTHDQNLQACIEACEEAFHPAQACAAADIREGRRSKLRTDQS